ncbi:hypothetical protein GY45DRAFT_1254523 [Cubamyces sp. BRFM 1775]|nr:hypothetical protein GY45DRAFT_1254523 [Cubamyces sp. BRFM 1775]
MVPNALESLPAEIFLEVSSYLASRADVLQLSQVSKTVYTKVLPALYADVDLHGAEQCERTLAMIERCPQVARHVRKLTVHPEHEFHPRPHDQYRAWDNAGVVSRCVMRAARNLDALHHFEWDGEDMLPDDRMWAELRSRCPCLKSIGTTFGCFLPRPTSNLFKFDDLCGFALTLKDGFYAHSLHVPSRESEPVFARLWDMLTIRCPNLESLALVGHSSEPSEAARLYAARWPKLRHLALGALVWSSNAPGQAAHSQKAPEFKDFLEAHPSIQSLHLLGRPSSNQLDLSGLDYAALPNLKEFSGSFVHLRMLVDRMPSGDEVNANTPPSVVGTSLTKTLKRVCFPHAMHLRDLTPVTISRVLLSLHALTSLKVTFAIQGGYDSNNILRTIATSCPFLHDLDITCTNKSSFFLETFANSLRGLSRLRTLTLTLVRTSGEEPMHVGAARIARANPRLRAFAITFIPPHAIAAAGDAPPPPLERGAFELTCDAHGIPVCLHVAQWHAAPWPWPWLGAWSGASSLVPPRGSVRRWVFDLRPSGHPDVQPKGMGALLVERGPAGEEARLMLFCLCLLVLTVWALVGRALRGEV